ncbi:MAG: hypothetical protein LC785_15375 [Acidobacteria bacterium]|nr:hypothetical protein [Acidobacteriota bacterium]MCA1643288.1 hypothetical protein [Acidobacteriota bacterium]
MTDQNENLDDAARDTSTEDSAGDVETAGETTAAAVAPTGDANVKPVGADTLVKVAGDRDDEGRTSD